MCWSLDRNVYTFPAVADGKLYLVDEDGTISALGLASGREQWSFKTGDPVYSGPAVTNGTVYVGSSDGHLYVLDLERGTKKGQ